MPAKQKRIRIGLCKYLRTKNSELTKRNKSQRETKKATEYL